MAFAEERLAFADEMAGSSRVWVSPPWMLFLEERTAFHEERQRTDNSLTYNEVHLSVILSL